MFAVVALTLALSGCAGIDVTTDFDPETDFTRYQTFAWMEGTGAASDDLRVGGDLMDQRFRRAIESELVSRGMQKAASGQPDVYIGYQVALDDRVDYQTINTYYGSGWGYRGVRRGGISGVGVASQTTAREYTMGTLVIDVFDAGRRELVWRGAGEGKVDAARNPQERQERINEAVTVILEDFPIG
jgi:hypothetical protein